jgi:hypothetical protein
MSEEQSLADRHMMLAILAPVIEATIFRERMTEADANELGPIEFIPISFKGIQP